MADGDAREGSGTRMARFCAGAPATEVGEDFIRQECVGFMSREYAAKQDSQALVRAINSEMVRLMMEPCVEEWRRWYNVGVHAGLMRVGDAVGHLGNRMLARMVASAVVKEALNADER